MSSILDLILHLESVSPELATRLRSQVTTRTIPKGAIIQRRGDLDHKSYVVREGLLRSYTIDEKGKEHVFMFAPKDWIIGDLEARAMDMPAELFIDALEDTEVDVINWEMEMLFHDMPKQILANELGRMLRRIAVLQRRVIMLMSAPAKDRYEEFLKTYPDIVQRVPQRMIASYLGITPEALSKIKGHIARSK